MLSEAKEIARIDPGDLSFRGHTYRSLLRAEDLYADHDHRLAVIVGSGPSLSSFDFRQLNRPWIFTFAINHEAWRNREDYTPDSWIYFDTGVANLHDGRAPCPMCEGGEDAPPIVFSRPTQVQSLIRRFNPAKGLPIPEWIDRIYEFETQAPYRPADSPKVYMNKTTATAALGIAVKMGFKHIALLGIDCYTRPESYYYTGQKPRKRRKGAIPLNDGSYAEDRHVRMMADWTHVEAALRRMSWPGSIYQCSIMSPMSCWPHVPWVEAVQRYGR